MLFNSYGFIFVFLPIVLLIYFTLAHFKLIKVSMAFLVGASLFFYSVWNIHYLPLLIFSMCLNFSFGKLIEKNKKLKKMLLIFGISINLIILGYFKYASFFLQTVNEIFGLGIHIPNITLPLGISFFTFTQMAYLIDLYRGEAKKYTILKYSLFVTIFPHLIAGPLLNHRNMMPQFSRLKNFAVNYKNIAIGIVLFSIGLFKKVAIADELAPWVKLVFDNTENITFIEAWIGAISYTFQLYFDFSGYSEMAIGLGLMLNFNLPMNFNSPYKSKSIIEFWRRWHMTLSEFLKDYLYIPLGGNRHGEFKKMRNLFITMLLGGLWHGAGWNFLVWGGLHGGYLIINHQWRRYGYFLHPFISWSITFICIVVAWVFFRAENLKDASVILQAMICFKNGILINEVAQKKLLILSGILLLLLYGQNPQEKTLKFKPNWKWLCASVIFFLVGLYKISDGLKEFLYFQF